MAKVKSKRASTAIDMTAMCDVAFLLLTFFMLTAKMKPTESVVIDTPSSISDTKLPDADVMTISVDKEGRVFFNVDNQHYRKQIIDELNTEYAMGLTDEQRILFAKMASFGVPRANMKQLLSLTAAEQSKLKVPGIPADTANNELVTWIDKARRVSNNAYRIVVKADGKSEYPSIARVIASLQALNINKFNLITDLEADPNKIAGASTIAK